MKELYDETIRLIGRIGVYGVQKGAFLMALAFEEKNSSHLIRNTIA